MLTEETKAIFEKAIDWMIKDSMPVSREELRIVARAIQALEERIISLEKQTR